MVCEVYRLLRNFLNLTNSAVRCGMHCRILDSDCVEISRAEKSTSLVKFGELVHKALSSPRGSW